MFAVMLTEHSHLEMWSVMTGTQQAEDSGETVLMDVLPIIILADLTGNKAEPLHRMIVGLKETDLQINPEILTGVYSGTSEQVVET